MAIQIASSRWSAGQTACEPRLPHVDDDDRAAFVEHLRVRL